jgi:hypothetical protein
MRSPIVIPFRGPTFTINATNFINVFRNVQAALKSGGLNLPPQKNQVSTEKELESEEQ